MNEDPAARPWSELRDSGLLWLINRVVFHPRGFAFGLVWEDGQLVGWALRGDGSQPWEFGGDEAPSFEAAAETLGTNPTHTPARRGDCAGDCAGPPARSDTP